MNVALFKSFHSRIFLLSAKLLVFSVVLSSHLLSKTLLLDNSILEVKRFFIASITLNSESIEGHKNYTKYANINFIGEPFIQALYSNLNVSQKLPKLITISKTNIAIMQAISKNPKLYLIDTKNLYIPQNFDKKQLTREFIETLLSSTQADAWATLDLTMSVWAQELVGTFTLYDKKGTPIWVEKIDVVSTYIIKDEKSPYFTEYDKIFDSIENRANHKSEILSIFTELGALVADNLTVSYNDYFNPKKTRHYSPRWNVYRNDLKKKSAKPYFNLAKHIRGQSFF